MLVPYKFGSGNGSIDFTETDVSQYFSFSSGTINAKLYVCGQLSFLAIMTEQTGSTANTVSPNGGLAWAYTIRQNQIPNSIKSILLPKFISYGDDDDFTAVSTNGYSPYPSIFTEMSFRDHNNGYYAISCALKNTSESYVTLPTDIRVKFSALYINQT